MTEKVAYRTTDPKAIAWVTQSIAARTAARARTTEFLNEARDLIPPTADGSVRETVSFFDRRGEITIFGIASGPGEDEKPPAGTRYDRGTLIPDLRTKVGKAYAAVIDKFGPEGNYLDGSRAVGIEQSILAGNYLVNVNFFIDPESGAAIQSADDLHARVGQSMESAIAKSELVWTQMKRSEFYAAVERHDDAAKAGAK
ncbi:hypothetical protein [Leucobacter sp. cx-169]|uniref:hypothetical protein n=1 Tax=Leucobacter sp. cx-169 TaxID=2770549 RepID=UPI00165DDD2E|nr:hypothetical protein [Leucobacter sp. cx-169]MBC9927181.1 hypothetical protein [Leucobacter sp. cx-169]